jgi:hypothetical protein
VSAEEHTVLLRLANGCLDPAKIAAATASGLPAGTFEKRRLERHANDTWSEIAPLEPTQALNLAESHHLLTVFGTGGVSFLSTTGNAGASANGCNVHGWNVLPATSTAGAVGAPVNPVPKK